jgi:hypothetical protein
MQANGVASLEPPDKIAMLQGCLYDEIPSQALLEASVSSL